MKTPEQRTRDAIAAADSETTEARNKRGWTADEVRETFPEYLNRVGDDFAASGHEATAEDYHETALRLSRAIVALRAIAETAKKSGGSPAAVSIAETACNTASAIEANP
jgi:hypothetical protein